MIFCLFCSSSQHRSALVPAMWKNRRWVLALPTHWYRKTGLVYFYFKHYIIQCDNNIFFTSITLENVLVEMYTQEKET